MSALHPKTEVMPRKGRGTGGDNSAGKTKAFEWGDVEERLTKGGWYWLSSVRPDGRPHVMPIFAVWSAPSIFIASKRTARKSRNLVENGHCVISSDKDDLHLVIEGEARDVREAATLQKASDAFHAIYDWPTEVDGDQLEAPYGAPTSGGPPYGVFEITPVRAFGFPADGESFEPTRWTFER
jgi:hypothetical protein